MQKILINDIGFMPGNNRIPIISKIRYWQKNNYEVSIFCTSAARQVYEKNLTDVKFILLPYASTTTNRFLLIYEYLKRNIIALLYISRLRNRFDVVYSISAVLDLLLFPIVLKCFDKRFHWCVVFDNVVPLKDDGNRTVRRLAHTFFCFSVVLLKKADSVFAISEELKQYLLEKGIAKRAIVVTGNAVEADLIEKARKQGYDFDALFVGRINETKGIYDMLKVLSIVRDKYPDFKLAVIGSGDKATEVQFKSEIIKSGLSGNVQLLGGRFGIEKYKIIKSSKLFLFLSTSESYGVALLEAVCCGLKAVVYALEPYEKIYLNNEIVKVPKHDYVRAAGEVLKIIGSNDLENRKGMLLLDKFSWDRIAEVERKNFL